MSVLSRTPHRTHEIVLPDQRSGSPVGGAPQTTGSRRARTAGLLIGGVVVLSSAGTGTWMVLDDGSPVVSTPAPTAQVPEPEARRDAALARRDGAGRISDAVRRSEARRDAARAGQFGR